MYHNFIYTIYICRLHKHLNLQDLHMNNTVNDNNKTEIVNK